MPLRFTHRLSLVPGLRMNLSKSASLSVGHRVAFILLVVVVVAVLALVFR